LHHPAIPLPLSCHFQVKPVIASMANVSASGGYYMAMACSKIVAEQLTITGSIGVITGGCLGSKAD
jgi:ClpP class serine protease